MNAIYDKNCKARNFSPGDKVLVILPIPGQPFRAKYHGPYLIEKKFSDTDYIVQTPGCRKQKRLCHMNMIGKYHDRSKCVPPKVIAIDIPTDHNSDRLKEECRHLKFEDSAEKANPRLRKSEMLANIHEKIAQLTQEQQCQLSDLLREYLHLFPDVPWRTDLVSHDIEVGD
ncbi:Hypothetical predicted protein [Octopus vulgaris]|uniref:Integrase p58-like C-terminal domain-containing protein n=1 Tax=Octopus vulgaris TaxID=6645 RepID=A0AA36EVW9_OCTVU|nr:Hypothetical predicted protein [Octopus vulgaris]